MEKQTRTPQREAQSAAEEAVPGELPQEIGSVALRSAEAEMTESTQERMRIFKMLRQYRGV